MKTKEMIWTTANGEKKPLSEIDDQHLCNILWFNEVFHGWSRYNSEVQFLLGLEWHRRCTEKAGKPLTDGEAKRLPWKPLPILTEIARLKRMKMIHVSGSIIKSKHPYSGNPYDHETIGSITHIENWKDL